MQNGVEKRYDNFALNYCLNGENGAKAARDAGYSKNGDNRTAVRLLSIEYIKDKIRDILAEMALIGEITKEEVIGNARLQVVIGRIKGDAMAIRGGNEQLGKLIGAFIDKHQEIKTEEQVELTEKQTLEANRLANIRLREGA